LVGGLIEMKEKRLVETREMFLEFSRFDFASIAVETK
jgi:hypothetical protein